MMKFFKKDPVANEIAVLKKQIAAMDARQELALLSDQLEARKRADAYGAASPDIRQRMDAEEETRRMDARHKQSPQRKRKVPIDPYAVQLLTRAQQSVGIKTSEELVTIHAQESILEAVNGTPYAFDLIAEYRQLLAVPTLIRELWPYKPTILRTLPMLDFARWICRVVYEECLTAKGLVRGKQNYIMRGMRAKIVTKDPEKDVRNDSTAKEAQKIIDEFVDIRDYDSKRKERYRRNMIEGESFLWVEDGNLELPPEICYVEPDYIRPSQKRSTNQEDPSLGGNPQLEDWSFGILTPHHRYWDPKAYQIVWNDNQEQVVKAKDMIHTAVRERSNIKRCLPPMFCMTDDLIRMTLLRAALADASKFRAGIGGVIKFEKATNESTKSWAETITNASSTRNFDQAPAITAVTADNYTNVIALPPGKDWVAGPDAPDATTLQTIYNWHIQAIAQAMQVPEWMVSGAAAGSSFASSLTSESSSIIEFEASQENECEVDRKVLKRILAAYIGKRLPANFFDDYDVEVEGESMVSRDMKSETETAIMAVEARMVSRQTMAAQLGFDFMREKPLIDEEVKEMTADMNTAEMSLGLGSRWTNEPQTTGAAQKKQEKA